VPVSTVLQEEAVAAMSTVCTMMAALLTGCIWQPLPVYQSGTASFYHEPQRTAWGERYDPDARTAAHKTLPNGTVIVVRRKDGGGKAAVLKVTDRGPYYGGRVVDVSRQGARDLDLIDQGVAPVTIQVVPASPMVDDLAPMSDPRWFVPLPAASRAFLDWRRAPREDVRLQPPIRGDETDWLRR
jgi:rare lipoprotein A (peptidoglycan hydrolase)